MNKVWFWLLGTLLFLTSCRTAQKAVYAPDQLVPKQKSLLWKISGNGLDKPSWLYGTIHVIPRDEFDFSDATLAALKQARRVTFEIDMREMTNLSTQLSLMTKAFMPGGKTLRDLLSEEDYAFVRAKMDDKGLPPGMLERMKPMFVSTLFAGEEDPDQTQEISNRKMTSVEMEIYRIVKKRKLESAGLETASYQLAIFDSIPYDAQARMLVESLRSGDGEGGNELAQMIDLYKAGDIDAMQAMIAEEGMGMAQYEELLLRRRNHNWIPVMGRMMREKSTFFAVGAGHLGGEHGVIALLRQSGYLVEPAYD